MQIVDNKESAKWRFEYLLDLFVSVLNNKVRACDDENLLAKAISYGRSEEEAEEDIRQVVNLYDAVVIFLKNVVKQ